MEEKKDKILEEEREEFEKQLKEILDAGPDKYQRKKRDSIINESSSKKYNYREVEDKKYIFLYTLIRIIAVAVALFLLVKFGINIASR